MALTYRKGAAATNRTIDFLIIKSHISNNLRLIAVLSEH